MNETLKEQISAYVDGELPEGESELLVRRLSQDPSLRALAENYMAVGRALRGETAMPGIESLRHRIARELGTETAAPVTPVVENPPARFLRPVAGIAIAASVAVLALVGLQRVGTVDLPQTAAASSDLAAIAIDEAPLYTEPPVAEFVSSRPSATLTRYYQHHNERAADIGGSGIFSRLVELELRGGELVPPAAPLDNADASTSPPDSDVAPGPDAVDQATNEQ